MGDPPLAGHMLGGFGGTQSQSCDNWQGVEQLSGRQWSDFFCRTFLRAGHQPSGAYSADVLLLLPLAIDLIYELTEMVW